MSLKKHIIKNTWYITSTFLIFSLGINFTTVKIAGDLEEIISGLTTLQYGDFIRIILRIASLCLLYVAFDFIYWFFYHLSETKSKKLATEYCYRRYLGKELRFFSTAGAGDITYSILSLAVNVGYYYASFWQMLSVSVVTLIVLFTAIAARNLLFAFGIFVGIGSLIAFTSFLSNKISEKTDTAEDFAAQINNTMIQSFQGITVIRLLRRENYFARLFQKGLSEQSYQNDIAKNTWYTLYLVFYEVMQVTLPVVVLLAGFFLQRKGLVSIGALIAVYSMVGLLQEPIRNIADSVTYFKEHKNRMEKLGGIVEAIPGEQQENTAGNDSRKPENIPEIRKISVRIDTLQMDGHVLLQNTGFEIEKGDVVSLKGPSGCGKSTLLKRMIGLAEHEGCEVFYDGLPQNEIPDVVRFSNIALVEQKPFLFSAGIMDNILLGESFDPSLVDEVIHVCALKEMIAQYGADKKVDWTTGNISGGEMQRVTIARILIRRPNFLFLDEITASLDEKTAVAVAENIVAFAKKYGLTVVAVSHKDEFARLCNKQIALTE